MLVPNNMDVTLLQSDKQTKDISFQNNNGNHTTNSKIAECSFKISLRFFLFLVYILLVICSIMCFKNHFSNAVCGHSRNLFRLFSFSVIVFFFSFVFMCSQYVRGLTYVRETCVVSA